MPRRKFECDSTVPYHLCARSNNRDWFALPTSAVWRVLCDYLYLIHMVFGVKIHSFVLMNNHFHLVASFPEANLSAAMNYFLRETSRVIGYESDRINHVYGTRIFRSRIGSFHHFQNIYNYVYRNPVKAGICEKVEDYEFSTLHSLLGRSTLPLPVVDDTLLFDAGTEQIMDWLNRPTDEEAWESIRKGLMRREFKLPPVKSSRRENPLESQLL